MSYLIISEHPATNKDLVLFWAPKSRGYTVDVDRAGRYTMDEASAICDGSDRRMVKEKEVLDRSKRVLRKEDAPDWLPPRLRPGRRSV